MSSSSSSISPASLSSQLSSDSSTSSSTRSSGTSSPNNLEVSSRPSGPTTEEKVLNYSQAVYEYTQECVCDETSSHYRDNDSLLTGFGKKLGVKLKSKLPTVHDVLHPNRTLTPQLVVLLPITRRDAGGTTMPLHRPPKPS